MTSLTKGTTERERDREREQARQTNSGTKCVCKRSNQEKVIVKTNEVQKIM